MANQRRWTCLFELEGTRYLAYGMNRDNMPVYRVLEESLEKMPMSFPSCMKFIFPEKVGRVLRRSPQFVRTRYGNIERPGKIPDRFLNA